MQASLRSAVRTHPLLAFFLLAFLFSWIFWIFSPLLFGQGTIVTRNLVALGAFGPALAALLLNLLNGSEGAEAPVDGYPVLYAWLAAGFAYLVCLPYASTQSSQASVPGWIARGLLWAGPALLVGLGFSRRDALRNLVFPTPGTRTGAGWYAAAILLYPAVLAAGYALDRALGGSAELTISGLPLEVTLTLLASFIYLALFGGPLGEEAGWRGYALPRLQQLTSPLGASLILALVWILWRMPLLLGGGFFSGLVNQSLSIVLTIFLYTWLYNRSGRNMLVCLLFHASVITAAVFLPVTTPAIALLAVASAAVIWLDKMWRPKSS